MTDHMVSTPLPTSADCVKLREASQQSKTQVLSRVSTSRT